MFRKTILTAVLAVLAISATVFAVSTLTTSVRFIIPSSTAFAISIPSSNSTFTTSGATAGIYFNSSSTTINQINASISDSGSASQTNSTAIFRYRNDGNVAINVTISFNTITSTCINVKASIGSTGWESTCTYVNGTAPTNITCTNWNSTSAGAKNVTGSLAINQVRDVWLWADYNSCSTGLDETDTITHTSSYP